VKVRGFRVEPGEIESVLRGHPSLSDAVVAAHGPAPSQRLAAWVIPAAGETPAASELAAWLGARLPAYMVPAAFAVVDAFPRTASGKTDRRALPEPDFAADAREYVPPRTKTEAALAELWAEVLRVDRVGSNDDFFGLGGHSLLAMQAWGGVQQRFGIELPLRALFDHPTLAALAAEIDAAERAALPPVEEPRLVARRRAVRAVSIAAAGDPAEMGED
jgi:acyl carrier protein